MRRVALVLSSLIACCAVLAQAQEPPGRVGRLAYADSGVSMYQDPEQGWDVAYVNAPITSENSLWTPPGARAELRLGGTALRLEEGTQLDVSEIADDAFEAGVARGALNVRVRYKQATERFAISTPQARFILEADGRYRIDFDPDANQSRLTVFSGAASMETSQGRVRVAPGQSIVVYGASSEYAFESAQGDAFDRWALERDNQWRDAASRRYVSTYMTGYEDLDGYGQWSQDPDYGALWFPASVPSGWAPYRNGRWSYVRPWGWTWIADEPWGYAPSHYGRWVFVRNRWGWDPGRRVDRPAWAPALVGWIGGAHWSAGGSPGSPNVIAWYPLAPWERYEPWFRTNANYLGRVNSAVRDRAPRGWQGHGEDWRRINRDRATTVVQRDAMLDRRPVQHSIVAMAPDVLRRQPAIAPAQVQQALPQHNELIRRHAEPGQAATALARRPAGSGAPAQATQGAPRQNVLARPDFSRRPAPAALAPAPANRPPFEAARPGGPLPGSRIAPSPVAAPLAVNPAARGNANPPARAEPPPPAPGNDARQRELPQIQRQQAQQRDAQQRQAREAQLQLERTQREAQQRDAQQREVQQRDAQQRQVQQRDAQQRDSQQRDAQQRLAREAQLRQERAQREAQQQRQRDAQQLQQQQDRAARAAQQQAQQAQQAAQQAQQAARQAQQAAQQAARAQEAQRAARTAPPPAPANPIARTPPPAIANPVARGEREKEADKAKEKAKDKEEKPR